MALLFVLLLSACNADPQTQQQANRSRTQLETAIAQAQSIGIPAAQLQPILTQQAQLNQTNAPLALLSNQPAIDYYTNLSQRYQMLIVQVHGLETQTTQQFDYQANQDLQTFGSILAQRQAQMGSAQVQTFADQLIQEQHLMAGAHYPKHYLQISNSAQDAIQSLRLIGPATNQLKSLQQVAQQLSASHLDVTALNQQIQQDSQLLKGAKKSVDFSHLIDQITTQLNETATLSTQAIPYVGAAKLSQFSMDIDRLKHYGQDTTSYQKQLSADQSALTQAKSLTDFLKLSSRIDSDVAAIQFPLLQGQANSLLTQYHKEVADWGNAHQFTDSYNGQSYNLDYEYDQQGIGSDADAMVTYAQTADDYQTAIDSLNDTITLLHAMEAARSDTTPWSQSNPIDKQLMQHFKTTSGQVIVVSLIQQTLRLYQDGNLVKAFQVTTGQFDKPSLPGFWHIFLRQSPTVFKSDEPKGSAFWYPDTNINFAMEYHDGGYYFHDSWWRADYGVGTNFPHYDSGGDESFSGTGSHGCINMPEDMAGWIYNNTAYGAAVLIY